MADQDDQTKPISLFYSYSHRDEEFRLKLETHLSALRRGGLISEWHDRKLEPGEAWKGEIDRHLTSADIVLLLVSADFIASDYCWGEEMTKALARHERGKARVIPVILRHCRWRSTPLADLQAVPRDAKPIRSWPDEDEAFDDVVAAIERAVLSARRKAGRREAGSSFRDLETPWCPELVVVQAGRFLMGSPATEEGHDPGEAPQHEVRFARPFALGRYPVAFEEYDHFCDDTGRATPPDQSWGRGRRPVIDVSWEDATAYCAWLSNRVGQAYRLPSEAEWEYACRAGTTTPFWTGATIGAEQANYDGSFVYGPGVTGEYRERTMPVDSFPANPWQLHDMHGNVWEWCQDCWNENYSGAPADGSAWSQGDCSLRVVRAGSWADRPRVLRSANRGRLKPGDRYHFLGFRVARTLAS